MAEAKCSLEGCEVTAQFDGRRPKGWAMHNNNWICPKHLAELDAPNVAIARIVLVEKKKAANRLAKQIEKSIAKRAAETPERDG